MEQTKQQRYQQLIEQFKKHQFSDPELLNPHNIAEVVFNYPVLNPWELWHNNLDARILLIGQDFSDYTYFADNLKNDWANERNNPTNKALQELFLLLNYQIGAIDPSNQKPRNLPLFFTNAILGIKHSENKKDMSKPVKDIWWKESADYLKQLIEIINPDVVIAMGMIAYQTICHINSIKPELQLDKAIAKNGGVQLSNGSSLYVVPHCSAMGRISNSFEKQKEIWSSIELLIKNQENISYKSV